MARHVRSRRGEGRRGEGAAARDPWSRVQWVAGRRHTVRWPGSHGNHLCRRRSPGVTRAPRASVPPAACDARRALTILPPTAHATRQCQPCPRTVRPPPVVSSTPPASPEVGIVVTAQVRERRNVAFAFCCFSHIFRRRFYAAFLARDVISNSNGTRRRRPPKSGLVLRIFLNCVGTYRNCVQLYIDSWL